MSIELRKKINRRHSGLKLERTSFFSHWKDLQNFLLTSNGRFFVTDRNKGRKRNSNIVDNTGTLALRTLSSGMMAGLTSPARPWFKLATTNKDLTEFPPVRLWLEAVEKKMREIFNVSNLYNVLPTTYNELGGFGTSAFLLAEDFDDVIRCYPYTIGEYSLGVNDKLKVDAIYREVEYTVGQLVQWFGEDAVSQAVKTQYKNDNLENWVKVIHAIEFNDDRVTGKLDSNNKAYRSAYYDPADKSQRMLEIKGYDEFPVMAPRWFVLGNDSYGTQCPGMDALGDIKQLQMEQKRKGQAIDKMVNPPMNAPNSMKNTRLSILPGDINFGDVNQGMQGFTPTFQVNPPLGELKEDISEVQSRIKRGFFEDLFLMLTTSDRREITAREIEERHEEKLLMLGPVLQRLNDELLDPLIDRTFNIMARAGILPEIPEELEGIELKVEYISILAQAQQSVGLSGLRTLVDTVAGVGQLQPQVIDKLNGDQIIDEAAEMLGVPAGVINSDEEVGAVRADRANKEAREQAQIELAQMTDGAKTLSETDTAKEGTALNDILSGAVG